MGLDRFLKKAKEIQDENREGSKKPPEPGHDESNWLVAYADMMTLLCSFFIMMLTMASMNAQEVESVKKEVSEHFGGQYEEPNQEIKKFAEDLVQDLKLNNVAKVEMTADGIAIIFKSTVFFDTLSAFILEPGRKVLDKLITGLQKKQNLSKEEYHIVVEGHTDSRPILSGNFPSNWELSSARASRVVRAFIEYGFDPKQMTAIGYSDTRPEVPNRKPSGEWDDQGLIKNRRVVVRVIRKAAQRPADSSGT